MSSSLPHVADLERGVVCNLPLDGEIPLIGNCWLNIRSPSEHGSADEGITGWRSSCAECCLGAVMRCQWLTFEASTCDGVKGGFWVRRKLVPVPS